MWIGSRYYFSVRYKTIGELDTQIIHMEDMRFHAPTLAEKMIADNTLRELKEARRIKMRGK